MMFQTLGEAPVAFHHFDAVHMYTVTEEQIQLLRNNPESQWKISYSASFSGALVSLANVAANISDVTGKAFFINLLLLLVTLVLGIFFYRAAGSEQKKTDALEKKILSQPWQKTKGKKKNIPMIPRQTTEAALQDEVKAAIAGAGKEEK